MKTQFNFKWKVLSLTSLVAATLLTPKLMLASSTSTAQGTSSSTLPAATATKPVSNDKADQVITNTRMRADIGSLSKLSFRSFWRYQGGSLSDPWSATRPNITGRAGSVNLQNLSADIGARYRLTSLDALNASIGLNMVTPFHNSINTTDAQARSQFQESQGVVTLNDPALTYQRINRLGTIQSRTYVKGTLITQDILRRAGFRASQNVDQAFLYDFGGSKFTTTLFLSATMNFFDADTRPDGRSLRGNQNRYRLGAYPGVEYNFTDSLSVQSFAGLYVYDFNRDDRTRRHIVYQSLSLGWGITRDIFISPELRFIWDKVAAEQTNLTLNANINF